MAIYCVDDGGDGSQTNTTHTAGTLDWSKADTSIANLISYDAAALTTNGNIIYIGDDHNDAGTGAARTFVGPTSAAPVIIISADRTQATPTYKVGTGKQLLSDDGAYAMTLDGSFAMHGIRLVSGAGITVGGDADEYGLFNSCKFVLPANGILIPAGAYGRVRHVDCTVDISADSTTPRSQDVVSTASCGLLEIVNMQFVDTDGAVGGSYRTGRVFAIDGIGRTYISGCDLSGFDNATLCELSTYGGFIEFFNCKLATTWGVYGGNTRYCQSISLINCYTADAPEALFCQTSSGYVQSSTSVYRSNGATVETQVTSWKMVSSSETGYCVESAPLYTPWMYGTVTNGTRTFSVAVAHSNAGSGTGSFLTDAEAWLEIEVLGTDNSPLSKLYTDQRSPITAAAADQATDSSGETWTGSPGADLQILSCASVVVGESGLYRARVALAVADKTVYVDPKVTVT
jgi:hypothetical protein